MGQLWTVLAALARIRATMAGAESPRTRLCGANRGSMPGYQRDGGICPNGRMGCSALEHFQRAGLPHDHLGRYLLHAARIQRQCRGRHQQLYPERRVRRRRGQYHVWYRAAATSPAIEYAIQTSQDATNWSTVATLSGVNNTNWIPYATYVYDPDGKYIRLLHTAAPTGST
jgi:hypothetical protein